jgi:signal transduction histidine kinase
MADVLAEPDLPLAMGDEQRTWQVITNLLSNAIKFAPSSHVDVDVGRAGDFLQVSVRDRGPGIAPEDQEVVFEKFRRVERNGEKRAGTGLGLYISKSIVEAQGGKIWVESEVGRGATFKFTLPVISPTA